VGELKASMMSIQLVNLSVKYPMGILEDVPLQVEKIFMHCDFVVMGMEEYAPILIILGCPFPGMAREMIDIKNRKLSL